MGNETNQLPTPDEAPDHTVQDTSDFQEAGQQQEPQRQPQKKEEADEPQGEKTYYVDQNRANILANARKAKQETSLEFTGSDNDPKVRYGANVEESDLGELEQEALRRQREVRAEQFGDDNQGQDDDQGQQQQQRQERPLPGMDPELLARQVKIVVNGQEQIITVEEAIRRTQKIAAADDYFTQAKQTLHEVKELRHEIGRGANQQHGQNDGEQRDDQQYDEHGEKRDTTADFALSLEDAEKIQLGSTEEVRDTLSKLFKTAAPAVSQVDVAQEVRNTLELERTKNEVSDYAKKYPVIREPVFQKIMADFSREAIVEDLINVGITVEQLKATVKTPAQLTELHRQARNRGIQGIRSPLQIVQYGHEKAHEWKTGKPLQREQQQNQGQNDTLNLQQREQRKLQLQPQPQQRRQTQANMAQQTKTQDQGRSGRFEAIKKARGQPV